MVGHALSRPTECARYAWGNLYNTPDTTPGPPNSGEYTTCLNLKLQGYTVAPALVADRGKDMHDKKHSRCTPQIRPVKHEVAQVTTLHHATLPQYHRMSPTRRCQPLPAIHRTTSRSLPLLQGSANSKSRRWGQGRRTMHGWRTRAVSGATVPEPPPPHVGQEH